MTKRKNTGKQKQEAFALKNGVLHTLVGNRYVPITHDEIKRESAIKVLESIKKFIQPMENAKLEFEKGLNQPTNATELPADGNLTQRVNDITLRIAIARREMIDVFNAITKKVLGVSPLDNESKTAEGQSISSRLSEINENLIDIEGSIGFMKSFVNDEI